MQAQWTAVDYRILGKDYDTKLTARLLGRDEEEIESKLLSYNDATLDRWYKRHRTEDGPATIRRIKTLAKKIWKDDFSELVEEGESLYGIYSSLQTCFEKFNRSNVKENRFVEDSFIAYFRVIYVNYLKSLNKRKKFRKTRPLTPSDRIILETTEEETRDKFLIYSSVLFRLALDKVKPRMRSIVKFKFSKKFNLNADELSKKFKITKETVQDHYTENKIVSTLQKALKKMVTNLPLDDFDTIVLFLDSDSDLNEIEIANLLMTDEEVIDKSIKRSYIGLAKRLNWLGVEAKSREGNDIITALKTKK